MCKNGRIWRWVDHTVWHSTLTDSLESLCTMGMGPRTNLYSIGGDPLTQLIIKNADSDKINGKDVVGDPMTHLCNQSNIAA